MIASTIATAQDVLRDALRRKETIIITAVAAVAIVFILSLDLFGLDGVTHIYRDGVLRVMGLATALCVIALACRQAAAARSGDTAVGTLAGRLLGVVLTAAAILLVLTVVFALAGVGRPGVIPWPMYLEFVYLQLVMMLTLAAVCFLLSGLLNLDAAIALGVVFYLAGLLANNVTLVMFPYLSAGVRGILTALNYLVPQLVVFDLSSRTVHAEAWPLLGIVPLLLVTLYGLVYTAAYSWLASIAMARRRTAAGASS